MIAPQSIERMSPSSSDDVLLDDAASLDGAVLRSLDAVHLAAARALGDDLIELVTYDHRMAEAAQRIDLPVGAPT